MHTTKNVERTKAIRITNANMHSVFCYFARTLTILDYERLPERIKDLYLDWSMDQFLKERARIEVERAGGHKEIARKRAMNAVNTLTTLEYKKVYHQNYSYRRHFEDAMMYHTPNSY